MPKTGSSAIQAFLALNQAKLMEYGISYPDPDKLSPAFQTSSGNCFYFHRLFSENRIRTIRRLIDDHLENSEDRLLLSSESLFHSLRLFPDRFFSVFNHYNFKIICFVRRQDLLYSSAFKQLVKLSGYTIMNLKKIENHIDFHSVLMGALKYIETENIIIRPYEKGQFYKHNIYDDFCKLIGVERDQSFCLPIKTVNPSLNQFALEYRRLLNTLNFDHGFVQKKNLINDVLTRYSVDARDSGTKDVFSVFSFAQQQEILSGCKERNEQLSRVFFGGKPLFTETNTQHEYADSFQPGLPMAEAERISRYIYHESKDLLIELYAFLSRKKTDREFLKAKNTLLPPIEAVLTNYEKKKALKIRKYLLIQRIVPANLRASYYEMRKRFTFANLARKLNRFLKIKQDKSK